jgi:hypothetical protein
MLTLLGRALVALCLVLVCAPQAHAQKLAKYGADFLSGGVGGRALGMGGSAVALSQDVASGYWNAAGLTGLDYPELAYMHVERFAGVVSFDYGSAAFPVNARSTIGVSFFRSGVNDIKNTLDAWDAERNQPKANYESYISTFSAADYAFFLSYARAASENLSLGVTGKVVRRTIGPFAEAWGYSFDVGAQYALGRFRLGLNLQDVAGMYQSWTVNADEFNTNDDINPATGQAYTFAETFGQELPTGGTYVVPPVARLGTGYALPLGTSTLTLGADFDLAFDGQETYAFSAGPMSIHPRFGTEFDYKGVLALRAGIARIAPGPNDELQFTPTLGAGLQLAQVSLDYGFGDFAGLTSDLGMTHRIAARLTLEQPRMARSR